MIPHYDRIYLSKDYLSEVETILSIAKPQSVLDVGCGTGTHAMEFAKSCDVVGIDIDEKSIECACAKTSVNPKFFCKDVGEIYGNFDLVVSLFNVINYIDSLDTLIKFCTAIRRLTNGFFIFDCWNGMAAILDNPKEKRIVSDKISVLTVPDISLMDQSVKVDVSVNIDDEKFMYSYFQTLWTPFDLRSVLNMVGFKSVKISEWMKPDVSATEKSWKIMVVCK